MARFELPPREYVPEWEDNRERPERERIVIFYRGWTVAEKAGIARQKMKMGDGVSKIAIEYQDKLAAMQARLEEVKDDDAAVEALDAEVDALLDEQSEAMRAVKAPFHGLALERVVAVEQGPDRRADTPDDIAYVLTQDWALMDEVTSEILNSGEVKRAEAPFSESPSTGG